jgi:hypothetical protein
LSYGSSRSLGVPDDPVSYAADNSGGKPAPAVWYGKKDNPINRAVVPEKELAERRFLQLGRKSQAFERPIGECIPEPVAAIGYQSVSQDAAHAMRNDHNVV